MQITGKDSIAKDVKNILQILFAVAIGIMIVLPILVGYYLAKEPTSLEIPMLVYAIGVYITGIPAIIIVYQFMGLFQLLKEDTPFVDHTVIYLTRVSIAGICIDVVYFLLIFVGVGMKNIYCVLFAVALCILFFAFSLAAYILAKLFQKANAYKQENDLTI